MQVTRTRLPTIKARSHAQPAVSRIKGLVQVQAVLVVHFTTSILSDANAKPVVIYFQVYAAGIVIDRAVQWVITFAVT